MTLSVKSRGTDGMLGDMGPSPVIGLGVRWEFSELVTQETKKSGRSDTWCLSANIWDTEENRTELLVPAAFTHNSSPPQAFFSGHLEGWTMQGNDSVSGGGLERFGRLLPYINTQITFARDPLNTPSLSKASGLQPWPDQATDEWRCLPLNHCCPRSPPL